MKEAIREHPFAFLVCMTIVAVFFFWMIGDIFGKPEPWPTDPLAQQLREATFDDTREVITKEYYRHLERSRRDTLGIH